MTFALVRQEKADDARASRAATPPNARTPEVSPFAPGPIARRRGVAVGRSDIRRGAVGRALDRALVPLGDDGRRAIVVRDTDIQSRG